MKFDIPVLFIFFNRSQVALQSFEKIKKCKPSKLYLASDGYRDNKPEEAACVLNLRNEILGRINWECEIKTLFHDKNLGCGPGVYAAINWFFENEEWGIILEDDCVVQDSFFNYMRELLKRYKNDQRIGMIAGYNPINTYSTQNSYLFSTYKACWGWGTWRRAWMQMDYEMKWRKTPQADDIIFKMGYKGSDRRECLYKLFKIDCGMVSAWDWQWYFSLAAQNQLCIFPSKNLVSNIGFGENATHTKSKNKLVAIAEDLTFPLTHPTYVVPHCAFDKAYHRKMYSFKRRIRNLIPHSIYLYLNKLLKQ